MLKLVIGQGMKFAVIGIVVGLLASFALTRVMQTLLFGVSATDPLIYLGCVLVMMLVALLASAIPAMRAASADPIHALRSM